MEEKAAPGNGHITLRDVHKGFGSLHAVRGVSLIVRKNEFVTLLGPSGCGKTTLLRLIGGFERADSGVIEVAGRDVARTPTRERQTRMVFQQYALFPHMTVGQNVEFGLRMRGMAQAERVDRVHAALDMVKLREKIGARPAQLSGGQQQRIALARAIVTEPSVLLLDEPLAALDLQLRKAMQLELKNLQRLLGITFIYVTHDQTEALTMSDRIIVMSNGVIEQVGASEEIYDRPASRFVANFIGEANVFEGSVLSINGTQIALDIDGMRLALPHSWGMKPAIGQVAAFMVRPEALVIKNDIGQTTDGIRCRVVQKIYLGATTRILLSTSSGRQLIHDADGRSTVAIGDVVVAHWDADSVRWLKDTA